MGSAKIRLSSYNEARRFRAWIETLKDKSITIKNVKRYEDFVLITYRVNKNG